MKNKNSENNNITSDQLRRFPTCHNPWWHWGNGLWWLLHNQQTLHAGLDHQFPYLASSRTSTLVLHNRTQPRYTNWHAHTLIQESLRNSVLLLMTIRGQRIDIFNSTGFSVWPSCLLWCLCLQRFSVPSYIYPPLLPVLRRLLWLERWLRMQASEYGGESRRWFHSINISIVDLGYKGNACKWSQKINNTTKISSHAVINKHWWIEVSIKQIFKTINRASFNHTF